MAERHLSLDDLGLFPLSFFRAKPPLFLAFGLVIWKLKSLVAHNAQCEETRGLK